MAIVTPAWCVDQAYPFYHLRKLMSALATAGVVSPSTDFIVSPSSGLQVQITSGVAFVQQTVNVEGSSAYNGLYMVINDATANPSNTITAPVSNPRIDQVILRVYDVNEQGLGGSSKAQLEWLGGTESASASLSTMGPGLSNPGAATLPDNSLRLAYALQTVGEGSISSGNILADGGPHAWHPLALPTGWGNFSGSPIAAVRQTGDVAELRGVVQNNTGASNFMSIPLPTGFKPSVSQIFGPTEFKGVGSTTQTVEASSALTGSISTGLMVANGDCIPLNGLRYYLT